VPSTAVLAHGAGSRPAVARDLLAPACLGTAAVDSVDARDGVERVADRIHEACVSAARAGRPVSLVGGISLGAHAAARWALEQQSLEQVGPVPALLLVMPAWAGEPGPVAAMTAATADEIEREGSAAVLDRLRRDPALAGDWVLRELERSWADGDDAGLVRALRLAASSPAPSLDELARVKADVVAVVALADDPLHPEDVARQWADAIPGALLATVPRHAPAAEPGVLGRVGRELLTGSR
jgi:hypothetical protein